MRQDSHSRPLIIVALVVTLLLVMVIPISVRASSPWTLIADGWYEVKVTDDNQQGANLVSVPTGPFKSHKPRTSMLTAPLNPSAIPVPTKEELDASLALPETAGDTHLYLSINGLLGGKAPQAIGKETRKVPLGTTTMDLSVKKIDKKYVVSRVNPSDMMPIPSKNGLVALTGQLRDALWVYDPSTQDVTTVVKEAQRPADWPNGMPLVAAQSPVWSPNGEMLYYASNQNHPGPTSVWGADLKTGEKWLLMEGASYGEIYPIAVRGNGEAVATGLSNRIWTVKRGGDAQEVVSDAVGVTASPDGNLLAYYSGNLPEGKPFKAHIVDLASGRDAVIEVPVGYRVQSSYAIWNPSSTSFAFYVIKDSKLHIAVADLSQGEPQLRIWAPPKDGQDFNNVAPFAWASDSCIVVGTSVGQTWALMINK